MDYVRFADALYVLRFEAGKNIQYHSGLASYYSEWDFWITLTVVVATVIGLFCTIAGAFAPTSQLGKRVGKWPAVVSSALGCVAALTLMIYDPGDQSLEYATIRGRWGDLRLEAQSLTTRFLELNPGEAAPEPLVSRLLVVQAKHEAIEMAEPAYTDEPRLLDCWHDQVERTFGEGYRSQKDVHRLKKENPELWSELKYKVIIPDVSNGIGKNGQASVVQPGRL